MTYHHNSWPSGHPGAYGPHRPGVYAPPMPAQVAAHPYGYPYGQPPVRKSHTALWAGLAVVIAAAVVAVLVGVFMTLAGGRSVEVSDHIGSQAERILDDNLDVESVGDGVKKTTNYGMLNGELPVKLTNTGDESASFTVYFEVISKSDMVLSEATASASDVAPGQSITTDATFSMFFSADEVKLRIIDVSMS